MLKFYSQKQNEPQIRTKSKPKLQCACLQGGLTALAIYIYIYILFIGIRYAVQLCNLLAWAGSMSVVVSFIISARRRIKRVSHYVAPLLGQAR